MSEEIDIGGILVPAVDLEATPESIKLVLRFLLEERNQMKQKIEELEEKLNKNRDFQAISERTGVSKEIGQGLLVRGYRLFHWWHRVRDGTLSKELFVEAVELLKVGLHQELISAAAIEIGVKEKTPLAKTVRTCRRLLKVEDALWTFVYHDGLEHRFSNPL